MADTAALGPVVARAFMRQPGGKDKHQGLSKFILGTAKRVLRGRLTGSWKRTPFFDTETMTPVATPRVLTSEERATLPLRR